MADDNVHDLFTKRKLGVGKEGRINADLVSVLEELLAKAKAGEVDRAIIVSFEGDKFAIHTKASGECTIHEVSYVLGRLQHHLYSGE